jgi:hypothetical protein
MAGARPAHNHLTNISARLHALARNGRKFALSTGL